MTGKFLRLLAEENCEEYVLAKSMWQSRGPMRHIITDSGSSRWASERQNIPQLAARTILMRRDQVA